MLKCVIFNFFIIIIHNLFLIGTENMNINDKKCLTNEEISYLVTKGSFNLF